MIKLIPRSKLQLKIKMLKEGSILLPNLTELSETPDVLKTRELDFSGIKTTKNRPYNIDTIKYINNKLSSINPLLRSVILASIIEESGGNPLAVGPGKFYGLLQWSPERYTSKSNDSKIELDNQIQYILDTYNNTSDRVSWTHGGTGSGYKTRLDAYNTFINENSSLEDVNYAFTLGYVRPSGKAESAKNRLAVAQLIYNILTLNYSDRRLNVDEAISGQNIKPNYLSLVKRDMNKFNLHKIYKEGGNLSKDDKDINLEQVKLLRKKYPDLRPFKQMTDEQIMFLMNHVASNSSNKTLNYV